MPTVDELREKLTAARLTPRIPNLLKKEILTYLAGVETHQRWQVLSSLGLTESRVAKWASHKRTFHT
jgi:hypothetical protein